MNELFAKGLPDAEILTRLRKLYKRVAVKEAFLLLSVLIKRRRLLGDELGGQK